MWKSKKTCSSLAYCNACGSARENGQKRSITYVRICKRMCNSVVWPRCGSARELAAAKHDVFVEEQENEVQGSMMYVWKCKGACYRLAVAININIPPHPTHPQNVNTSMTFQLVWTRMAWTTKKKGPTGCLSCLSPTGKHEDPPECVIHRDLPAP